MKLRKHSTEAAQRLPHCHNHRPQTVRQDHSCQENFCGQALCFIGSIPIKDCLNQGEKADLFFWRDSNGNEVDVIAEQSGRLVPLEIKSGKTLSRDSTRGLSKYMSLADRDATNPTLIYGGNDSYKKKDAHIISWRESGNILF